MRLLVPQSWDTDQKISTLSLYAEWDATAAAQACEGIVFQLSRSTQNETNIMTKRENTGLFQLSRSTQNETEMLCLNSRESFISTLSLYAEWDRKTQ